MAAAIPNTNAYGEELWSSFRVSVDAIERLTGYELLSNVPDAVEVEIESQSDKVKVQAVEVDW